jgi:hypothetical protein
LHLDVDRPGLHALKGHRRYARHHVRPPPGLADGSEHLQNNRPSARGKKAGKRSGHASSAKGLQRLTLRADPVQIKGIKGK